jgi:hypothetical protein
MRLANELADSMCFLLSRRSAFQDVEYPRDFSRCDNARLCAGHAQPIDSLDSTLQLVPQHLQRVGGLAEQARCRNGLRTPGEPDMEAAGLIDAAASL